MNPAHPHISPLSDRQRRVFVGASRPAMAGESDSKKCKTMASGVDDYPPDVEVLMDRVVKQGLPCHIVAVAEEHGFFMLKLEPLEGWQHIATPEAVARETDKGWAPHISLGWNLEAATWATVVELWDGVTTVVRIERFWSYNAMLSREGVGGCEAVWAGFCEGYPHRTWYGLHVSM